MGRVTSISAPVMGSIYALMMRISGMRTTMPSPVGRTRVNQSASALTSSSACGRIFRTVSASVFSSSSFSWSFSRTRRQRTSARERQRRSFHRPRRGMHAMTRNSARRTGAVSVRLFFSRKMAFIHPAASPAHPRTAAACRASGRMRYSFFDFFLMVSKSQSCCFIEFPHGINTLRLHPAG